MILISSLWLNICGLKAYKLPVVASVKMPLLICVFFDLLNPDEGLKLFDFKYTMENQFCIAGTDPCW